MSEFLYQYHPVEPTTWFYLSSLLTIGLFFKFSRFWSVRNLDLMLLILLGPGLLFVQFGNQRVSAVLDASAKELALKQEQADPTFSEAGELGVDARAGMVDLVVSANLNDGAPRAVDELVEPVEAVPHAGVAAESAVAPDADPAAEKARQLERGHRLQRYGYFWLFAAGSFLLVRLLADPTMVRRPLLEPNLSAGGLTFIGCSLFVFLMANVVTRSGDEYLAEGLPVEPRASEANARGSGENERTAVTLAASDVSRDGPGHMLISRLGPIAKKVLVIFAQLTIVVGMVLIGYRHFDNIVMGIGAATLYLMLPYTALMTGGIRHVLPAAGLVWAVLCYRRPLAAGLFLGFAGGISYYPLFLLPLWFSFYWPRGLVRFTVGVVSTVVVLMFVLFSGNDVGQNFRLMFGLYRPAMEGLQGIWNEAQGGWHPYFRIPMLAAFVVLASSMALWPAQKNLGTLLSCSAAVMVAVQFWHGYGGGIYMAWYLPLLLLTIFRPNLEDRVALTVLTEGWLPRRLSVLPTGRAA